jgi:hypothetical protein
MCTGTTSMNNTLGDTLVVESVDLLAANLVLEQVGASLPIVVDTKPTLLDQ